MLTLLPLALFVDLFGIKKIKKPVTWFACSLKGELKVCREGGTSKRLSREAICLLPPPPCLHLSALICWVATQLRVGDVSPLCLRGRCTLSWVMMMMMMHSMHAPFEKFGSVSSLISLQSHYTPRRLAAPCHGARIDEVTLETQALPN